MNDQSKTKHELIQELVFLRKRIAELSQYESEQKKAEESLLESEDKYKSLIENIPDIIFITIDLEGKITFISKRTKEILGYENEETINMSIFNFIPEEDHQRVMETLQKGMKGEKIKHVQLPVTAKSGKKLFFDFSFSRIYKDGVVVGAQGTAVDVTERKQAEEALRYSEERYRRITENMGDMVSDVDAEGFFQYISPSHQRILGYRPEDLLGTAAFDKFHPDDKDRVTSVYMEGVITKTDSEAEYRYRHADGHYVWLRSSGHIILDGAGEYVGSIINSSDITEHKRLEEVLRESEEKYRELVRYAPAGIYEVDYEKNLFISVNDAICEYTGYTRDELLTMNFFNLFTEESQKLMLARLEKLMANEIIPQTVEYCIRTKAGEKLWVHLSARYIYDSGKLKGATGIIYNITERKKAEEQLWATQERLRLALQVSKQGYYEWDIQNDHLYYSDQYLEILEFGRDELEPRIRSWKKMIHPQDKKAVLQALKNHIDGRTSPYEETYRLKVKSGAWRWFETMLKL